MDLTELRAIMRFAPAERLGRFLEPLQEAMAEFGIHSAMEQACFLAQIAHESGEMRYLQELASGEAYEGRAALGNIQPGDGVRFKGRGLIQITGRDNYRACGAALGLPLEDQPELLEEPVNACRSAAWYWRSRNLNAEAAAAKFGTITRKINGGYNGLDDRCKYWARALVAMRPSIP